MNYRVLIWLAAMWIFAGELSAQHLPHYYEPSALYHNGIELFDKEKYSAAQRHFEAFIEQENAPAAFPENRALVMEAKYYRALCAFHLLNDNAAALLEEFAIDHPWHAKKHSALFYVGKLYYLKRNYRKSAQYLEELDPLSLPRNLYEEGQFMLGYAYFHTREEEKAAGVLEELTLTDGEYKPQANYYYGIIKYKEGDYQAGLNALTKVQDHEDYRLKVPIYISTMLLELGEYDQLDRYGSRLLHRDEEYDQKDVIYKQIGAALFEMERYDRAIAYLEGNLEIVRRPERGVFYRIGYCHYKKEEYEPAVFYFNKIAGGQDTAAQAATYYMAFCYMAMEKKEDARLAFRKAYQMEAQPDFRKEALLQFAKLSLETRYYSDAIFAFDKFVKNYPGDPNIERIQALKAEALYYSNNYREAIQTFEAMGATDRRARLAYQKASYYYATRLYEQEDYERAQKYFEKAAHLNTDPRISLDALFWQAEIAWKRKQYTSADKTYHLFLAKSGARNSAYFADAVVGTGWALLMKKDYRRAFKQFQDAVKLKDVRQKPDLYVDAALRAGDCAFVVKRYREALGFYRDVYEFGRAQQDYALYQTGLCRLRIEEHDAAIEDFEQVTQRYPASAWHDDAYFQIASTYLKWKYDYDAGVKYSEKLIKEHPNSPLVPHAYNNLGFAAMTAEKQLDAVMYFKTVLFQFGNNHKQAQVALDALAETVEADKLNDILDEFYRKYPNAKIKTDYVIYTSGRDLYEIKKDYVAAIRQLSRYVEKFPGAEHYYDAVYMRGESYAALNQNDNALRDFQKVAQGRARQELKAQALARAASIKAESGDSDGSQDLFEQALAQEDDPIDRLKISLQLGKTYMDTRQYEKAEKLYRDVLANPNTTEYSSWHAQLELGKALYAQGKQNEAFSNFKTVEGKTNNVFAAEAQYMICKILLERKQYEHTKEAVFYMKDAYASRNYWKARAFILLAQAFRYTDDYFQSMETLKSVIEYSDDKDVVAEAKKALEEIEAEAEKLPKEPPHTFDPEETDSARYAREAETGETYKEDETYEENESDYAEEKETEPETETYDETAAEPEPPAGPQCHLIAGTVRGAGKAEYEAANWRKKGFTVVLLEGTSPETYRISVYQDANKESVRRKKEELVKRGDVSGAAWIFTEK